VKILSLLSPRSLSAFLALLLCGCTTGPLYTFIVYADSAPRASSRLRLSEMLDPFAAVESRGIGSPTALKVSIYSFYLSTTATCSAPVPLIDYGTNPLTKEFYAKPTLFSGNPGALDYRCAVLEISDNLKFHPDSAAAGASSNCQTDNEYAYDGYRSDQSDAGTWKDLSGQSVAANGTVGSPSPDVVTLFASLDPAAAILERGLAAGQVIPLASAIQVPGEVTIYSSYLDAVVEASGACSLSAGLSFGLN
jgi:hypothetical protein